MNILFEGWNKLSDPPYIPCWKKKTPAKPKLLQPARRLEILSVRFM